MLIKNGLVFNSSTFHFDAKDILVKNGIISEIGVIDSGSEEIVDVRGARIIPGLVDVHTHGRAGFDFSTCSDEDMHKVARAYAKAGVTCVMPSIASAPLDEMMSAADGINKFCSNKGEAFFCGVHLEGKYLNPQNRGAHPLPLLAPLDFSELDKEILKECKALHISAAFELDVDGSFAKEALSMGATLGLAHTCADYKAAKLAEQRGVTSYTHLFNAMPKMYSRDGGAVCAALDGSSFAEIICDGIHVSPEMVALTYRHTENKRLVLISDSMEATGCPDGEYTLAGDPVTVINGIARTREGGLAGSTLTLFNAVKNLISFCNITLEEAIVCATANPCKEVGIYDRFGSIDVGKSADLIILSKDDELEIGDVIVRGEFVE